MSIAKNPVFPVKGLCLTLREDDQVVLRIGDGLLSAVLTVQRIGTPLSRAIRLVIDAPPEISIHNHKAVIPDRGRDAGDSKSASYPHGVRPDSGRSGLTAAPAFPPEA